MGSGKTAPRVVLMACVRCAEEACNELRIWGVSQQGAAAKAGVKLPRNIARALLLLQTACRAVWGAAAASVQDGAAALTPAEVDVLCEFISICASTEAPVGSALRDLCGALTSLAADPAGAEMLVKAVDRRTEMSSLQACLYRTLERTVPADTLQEETRTAAICCLGCLAAHLAPDADGPEAALSGCHRDFLVQGNALSQIARALPDEPPADTDRHDVFSDLEQCACGTIMYLATAPSELITHEEVEAVLHILRHVGPRNPTAAQCIAAAMCAPTPSRPALRSRHARG